MFAPPVASLQTSLTRQAAYHRYVRQPTNNPVNLIWPIIALLLGWLLSETSHRLRSRAATKTAIGHALTELIEVMHYSRSIEGVLDEMRKRVDIPLAERTKLLDVLHGFLPNDADLPKRFAAAIEGISGTHPVLAFQLRARDQIPVVVLKFRAMIVADAPGNADAEAIEALIARSAIEALEDSCRELAWSHGLMTWLRVRRFINKPAGLPSGYVALLDKHYPRR